MGDDCLAGCCRVRIEWGLCVQASTNSGYPWTLPRARDQYMRTCETISTTSKSGDGFSNLCLLLFVENTMKSIQILLLDFAGPQLHDMFYGIARILL